MVNTLTAHISPSHSSVHLQTKKPLSGVLSHVGSQWPLFLQRIESLKQNYEQWKMMEHLNAWNSCIWFYHRKVENIYLLTRVIHMAVFTAYARHTITLIGSIGVGTCSINTWILQTFVNVYFAMKSFPTISTKTLIIIDAIYATCTIPTRAGLTIVVVNIAMFAFIPR